MNLHCYKCLQLVHWWAWAWKLQLVQVSLRIVGSNVLVEQTVCDLWTDLTLRSGRDFHLIPMKSLHLLQRPLSDPAYLLVLARSVEMRQRAHCLLAVRWEGRKWTTATILPAFCNYYTLRELFRHIVSPCTGVAREASVHGDLLDETIVQVLDGSVISVYLSEGFSETIIYDLQEVLDRQLNLFHLPPNTTDDRDVWLLKFFFAGGCLGWSRAERPSVSWAMVSRTLWSDPPSW